MSSTEQPIKIVLVDDHAILREGLRQILHTQPDLCVVAEVSNGEDALQVIASVQPDVVLMDVSLPGLNGIQVISQLKLDQPHNQARIIVLTVYADTEQLIHAVRAGAAGFCNKDVEPARLIEMIRQVAGGYSVIEERIFDREGALAWADGRVAAMTGPYMVDPGDHYSPLSKREMEILVHVTQGNSNQEIAYQLDISHQTVKNHMTAILRKLDVQDRTQAAVYAIRQGWVRLSDIVDRENNQYGAQ